MRKVRMARKFQPASADARTGTEGVPSTPEPVPRVLQRSGPSTLVVSLPKDWIEREGLSAGQFVAWVREENGELRLHLPRNRPARPEMREFSVHLAHPGSPEQARRVLLSSYVLGYDRVRMEDPKGMPEEVRSAVEQTARELLGFALTEVSRTTLVATSFLDPTTHPVAEVVSRIGYTLDLWLERLERSLEELSPASLQRLPDLRGEVRRLHALTLRQLNLAAGNPRLARQLGVNRASHLLGTRVVTNLLDDIAEAVEMVASELQKLRHPPSNVRPILAEFHDRVQILRDRLQRSLSALRTGNASEAESVLDGRKEALEHYFRTETKLRRLSGPANIRHSLSLCSWWIGVARQHAEAVAEVAFTRSLDRSPSVLELSGDEPSR